MSVYDFGGPTDAPLLHFAHGNGFNGLTYRSILAPLAERFRLLAWDARGHGQSALPADPKRLRNWGTYREDLLALIEALGEPLYLAGHSLGGATSLPAAAAYPGVVRGLLLVEPALFPRAVAAVLSLARLFGLSAKLNPFEAAALRRRHRFADRAAMVEYYADRGMFKTWPRPFIADYVAGGTRPSADGCGIELSTMPEWEAATFSNPPPQMLPAFTRYKGPIILLCSAKGSTCPPILTRKITRMNTSVQLRRIDGTTHFLPMECPDLVRNALIALMEGQPLAG